MRNPKAQADEPSSYPSVGTVLAGRYHLDTLISIGGMGAVFRATDSFLDQVVAIKVLLVHNWDTNTPEMAKALANLRSEARASIRLTHPNIIRAYNYERDASWEFLVMEFVEGEDLRKYRKRLKVLPPEEVIRVGVAALLGLEHAHGLGIIHYDIKPANLLLTTQREVKLCDFGLSVLTALGGEQRSDGIVIGTPGYVSPEMITHNQADHRADLYSVAAMLYELCAGAPPFGFASEQAFYGHVRTPVPDIAACPRPLMEVIHRGLEKDPEIRFQSASAMRQALEAAALALNSGVEKTITQAAPRPTSLDAKEAPKPVERAPATPSPRAPPAPVRTEPVLPTSGEAGFQVATSWYSLDKKSWATPLPPLDSERTLVLAFGAPELIDQPTALAELSRAYPSSVLIGCSTAGEIVGTEVRDRSLAVSITRFGRTSLASATVAVSGPPQSFSAGEALARKLNRPGLRAVFVLSEGLKVNGSELVRGFNSVLDKSVVLTGGLSGDGSRFQRTWVISGGKIQPGLITAVGFYGDSLLIAHGSKGGWDAFGPERKVTRSEGNVLFELDGKPALSLYKQYLGDKADGLPATGLLFPLALRQPGDKDKYLVRTLLAVDNAKNSMTFAGDVPKGASVQLMKANFERLIGGASSAALMAKDLLPDADNPQALAIAVSCVGRRLVLGDRTDEEIEAVLDVLPKGTLLSGFYSYGELSPYASGSCDLHNQTMTLTVLSEVQSQSARPATAPAVRTPEVPVEPRAALLTQPEPRTEQLAALTLAPRQDAAPPANAAQGRIRSAAQATGLAIRECKVGDVTVLSLQGRLTESFQGRPLGQRLSGMVAFDLGEVERITSFGVREWLELLAAAVPNVTRLYLARCSEPVVTQLNMIRPFSGGGTVVSLYAPYQCDACKQPFDRLIDCEEDGAALRGGRPPAAICPRCQGAGAFDDEPASYLAFVIRQGQVSIPAAVREALRAALVGESKVESTEPVEKRVEGRATTLQFRGRIDDSVRWSRILDGLEGEVVLDFTDITGTTPEGALRFEQALAGLGGQREVEQLSLRACPHALVERLALANPARAAVESAHIEGRCPRCATSRTALIQVAQERSILLQGRDPTAVCRRCNGELTFQSSRALLGFLAQQDGAMAPAVVGQPVAAKARGRDPRWSRTWMAVAGAGAFLGLVVVLLLALWPRGSRIGAEATLARIPASSAAADPSVAPPPGPHAAATPTAKPAEALPPAWAERPFGVEGDEVLLVGRGGPSPSAEAAVEQARAEALYRLSEELLSGLSGTRYYDFVRAQLPATAGADPLARQQVARRYLAQQGGRATPLRTQVEVRQREGGMEVFAQYKLPLAAFNEVLASYRPTASFRGMMVARAFPLLETRSQPGPELVVIEVRPRTPAALAGLREGDALVNVNGRRVESIPTFTQILEEEGERSAGRALPITVLTGGEQRKIELPRARSQK